MPTTNQSNESNEIKIDTNTLLETVQVHIDEALKNIMPSCEGDEELMFLMDGNCWTIQLSTKNKETLLLINSDSDGQHDYYKTAFSMALAYLLSQLKILSLKICISDSSIFLAEILTKLNQLNSNLKKLDLTASVICHENADILAGFIVNHKTIEHLIISGNQTGDSFFSRFYETLEQNNFSCGIKNLNFGLIKDHEADLLTEKGISLINQLIVSLQLEIITLKDIQTKYNKEKNLHAFYQMLCVLIESGSSVKIINLAQMISIEQNNLFIDAKGVVAQIKFTGLRTVKYS